MTGDREVARSFYVRAVTFSPAACSRSDERTANDTAGRHLRSVRHVCWIKMRGNLRAGSIAHPCEEHAYDNLDY